MSTPQHATATKASGTSARRLEHQHLTVLRTTDVAYVQFGDASWCSFDLASDPTWRTELRDPAAVLPLAADARRLAHALAARSD